MSQRTTASVSDASGVSGDDVRATVAANAELGGSYDDALAASLLERVDAQARTRRRQHDVSLIDDTVTVVIALGSIGLGVVFVAASDPLGALGGTLATIVAWIGIVIVNVAHARSRARTR